MSKLRQIKYKYKYKFKFMSLLVETLKINKKLRSQNSCLGPNSDTTTNELNSYYLIYFYFYF